MYLSGSFLSNTNCLPAKYTYKCMGECLCLPVSVCLYVCLLPFDLRDYKILLSKCIIEKIGNNHSSGDANF